MKRVCKIFMNEVALKKSPCVYINKYYGVGIRSVRNCGHGAVYT